jgi:hypothetical protein
MLIAIAGLPGTGKSTLARRLADVIGGVVLCKDVVRATLFPPPVLDYSTDQDDVTMRAIYAAAGTIHRSFPECPILIDGRTFSRAYQVRDLLDAAASGIEIRMIECVCADDIAQSRLLRDAVVGSHPAGNRTPELYRAVKARAEPLTIPRLILDTGTTSLDDCLTRAIVYLSNTQPEGTQTLRRDVAK